MEKSATLVKAAWSTKPAACLADAGGFAVTQARVVSYEAAEAAAAAAVATVA